MFYLNYYSIYNTLSARSKFENYKIKKKHPRTVCFSVRFIRGI